MKNLIIIALLGLLIGCGNQSKKAKEGNNQPQTITNIDSVGIAIDELNVDSVDIAVDKLDEIEGYEGSLRFVHVFLKRKDNNVFLTKYCPESNVDGDEYIIDEGFVKYYSSDSSGIAIKANFLGDVLLNYVCVKIDDRIIWKPQSSPIKGIDSLSIALFGEWDVGDNRNIFQSNITYFGKEFLTYYSDFDVNDIIDPIINAGCPEDIIPFIGEKLIARYCDSSHESELTLWDVVRLHKKYPLKQCLLNNIDDEQRGRSTMLLYDNMQYGSNTLKLVYKNNWLESAFIGTLIIQDRKSLELINKVVDRRDIPVTHQ